MFALIVELEVKPAFDQELEKVLQTLVDLSQHEAATIFYAAHSSQDRPHFYVLYEQYADRAAWEAHLADAAVQSELKRFDTLLAAPPAINFLNAIASSLPK